MLVSISILVTTVTILLSVILTPWCKKYLIFFWFNISFIYFSFFINVSWGTDKDLFQLVFYNLVIYLLTAAFTNSFCSLVGLALLSNLYAQTPSSISMWKNLALKYNCSNFITYSDMFIPQGLTNFFKSL